MKAVRTEKEPHQLEPSEWCIYGGVIYARCPSAFDLVANLDAHETSIVDDVLDVSPSILCTGAPGESFHGFIERGEWLDENKRPIS